MTMPSAEPSPALKAVQYAEGKLNVHGTYAEAKAARDRLDKILTELAEMRDKRREAEDQLRDREADLALEEWGAHPDYSATKMDGHLKSVRHGDTTHGELRRRLSSIVSDIEGLEYDKQLAEVDIKIAVARLNELGGYLAYLAAVKRSQQS